MVKKILTRIALAMVDGLASELHAMKDAAPGDAKQPEVQQWFIPFTQPTAAVSKLEHVAQQREKGECARRVQSFFAAGVRYGRERLIPWF